MALYRTQIFKRIGVNGKEWSNSYHIEAATLEEAENISALVAAAEVSVHKNNVEFVRFRVSSELVGDNSFTTGTLNVFGAIPVTSGQLPLFNTVRVNFEVFGGRPSFKYLRLPLDENETQNGEITQTLAGLLETAYADPILLLSTTEPSQAGVVDESGNPFTGFSIQRPIQERQLRRRRRSKGNGGLSQS